MLKAVELGDNLLPAYNTVEHMPLAQMALHKDSGAAVPMGSSNIAEVASMQVGGIACKSHSLLLSPVIQYGQWGLR